jgi:hydrogenase/urease accessory protein HupE
VTRIAVLTVLLSFTLMTPKTSAHPLPFMESDLILKKDGTFQVEMTCDLDALALGVSQNTEDKKLVETLEKLSPQQFEVRVERLRELFRRRVRVRFNGIPAAFNVTFPDYGTIPVVYQEIPTVLGLTARLTGTVPPTATEVDFFASRTFPEVHLTIKDEARLISQRSIIERGARSDPFVLTEPFKQMNQTEVALQYLKLGFLHIVPAGADHILFILCIFLLSTRMRLLVWQVTCFTLAHALTLTLATFDIIILSPKLVEPLIAFSISCIAIENIFTKRLSLRRPIIVFLFGLIHGLGFSEVLRSLDIPTNERLISLVSFNAGIELGQLSVLGTAFITVGWLQHQRWYRSRIVVPVSSIISLVGLIWAIERIVE